MSNHTYSKKIGGDSIFMFVVIQVERETVMTQGMVLIQRRINTMLNIFEESKNQPY